MSTPGQRQARAELPVDRRVTPESLAAYARPRSSFPIGTVAIATGIAWITLPIWHLVVTTSWHLVTEAELSSLLLPALDAQSLSLGGAVVVIMLVLGMVPAAVLGMPLGALLVWLLRRVDSSLVHLAAFLGLGALVGTVTVGVMTGWTFEEGELWTLIPATALASAAGWLSVWRRLMSWEPR